VDKAAAACAALAAAAPPGARPLERVAFVSPNEAEVLAMADALRAAGGGPGGGTRRGGGEGGGGGEGEGEVRGAAAALLRAGVRHVLVTRGAKGLLWARAARRSSGLDAEVCFEELPALAATVKSTRGAGDSFVAGAAWGLLRAPTLDLADTDTVRAALRAGLRAAQLTVQSDAAISVEVSADRLEPALAGAA